MFRPATPKRPLPGASAGALGHLIFHAAVRHVRRAHGNAIIGLLLNIVQILALLGVMYFLFTFIGLRGVAVRGDYMLYLMSGILMFMMHTKTLGAVAAAESASGPLMRHAPMTSFVAIAAAALGTLYLQVVAGGAVLLFYHAAFTPITIHEPLYALGLLLLAWASGIAVGMIFLAARPWAPDAVDIASTIYQRINLIASGKMFLANTMPSFLLAWFDWNPLFHIIDQGRGAIFLNYNPHYSSLAYPVQVTLACAMIGLMGAHFTRRYASLSWGAGR